MLISRMSATRNRHARLLLLLGAGSFAPLAPGALPLRIPSPKPRIIRRIQILVPAMVDHRINRHMNHRRLAAGERLLDGRAQLFTFFHIHALATEALSDVVEAHVLAPVHAGLGGVAVAEGALVDAHFKAPGVVDGHHGHDGQVEAMCHFQLRDVVTRNRWW